MDYVTRDLGKIVENVVPLGREGLPNLMSTKQVRYLYPHSCRDRTQYSLKVLESWRMKRVIEPQKVDDVLSMLEGRSEAVGDAADPRSGPADPLPRQEIFRRIEEDRERHKRLRERRWVQPISHNPHPYLAPQLASFLPLTDDRDGEEELTQDIEFENDWETTSDWNEDDTEAVLEENDLCFPAPRFSSHPGYY